VQLDRIQIRQLPSLRVRLPVIGIALQQNRRSRLVVGHHERPQNRHFLLAGVCRENRYLIELPFESGHGRRKGNRDLRGRNNPRLYVTRSRTERISRRRMQRRIHQLLYRVSHVLRGKRSATDASSSTFKGSNVFGSDRRQNRSSPCAIAEPASIPRQTSAMKIARLLFVPITANLP